MNSMQSRKCCIECATIFLAIAMLAARAAPSFRGWVVGGPDDDNPTLLCTTNGTDWFRQGLGAIPRITLNSVSVSPSGARLWVVGAAHAGYASVFCSEDGGATWTRQGSAAMLPNNDLFKIRAAGERVLWAVGPDGTVVRTIDGGATWKTRPIPGFSGHLQAVAAIDDRTAWVGGAIAPHTPALFYTRDGGASWTSRNQGEITNIAHILGLHAENSNTIWAIGGPLGIALSTNAGESWSLKYSGFPIRDGNEIHVSANGAVWTATDSAVYWSLDRGQTWNSYSVADFCMGVNSPDGTNVWAASGNWAGGFIYHSADAGATWTQQLELASVDFSDMAFVPIRPKPKCDDYDDDGASDLALFDTISGCWYILSVNESVRFSEFGIEKGASEQVESSDVESRINAADSILPLKHSILAWSVPWGWPGVELVPGDYDGDGMADMAVFDPGTGRWYVRTMSGLILAWALPWTGAGLQPVPGDFDGDGASDLAVYDQDQGRWHVCSIAADKVLAWNIEWGDPGLTLAPDDFDGDGTSDLVLYDAERGLWYVLKIMEGPLPAPAQCLYWALAFGAPGMVPVPGDYDGNGADDLALFDQADGIWCIAALDGRLLAYIMFGAPGMTPLSGDYDRDGAEDLAVYDGNRGMWYAYSIKRGQILIWAEPWGAPGLIPVRR